MEDNAKLLTLPQRRLPDSWVQKIFSAMQGNYGSRWGNMWRTGTYLPDGQDVGLVNAMNLWAEKLGGYKDSPETFKRVLDCLPAEPPSLPQFLELCRHAYVPPKHPMLEHKMSQEEYENGRKHITEIVENLRRKMSINQSKGDDRGH